MTVLKIETGTSEKIKLVFACTICRDYKYIYFDQNRKKYWLNESDFWKYSLAAKD